jgi:hypothetical protein
MSLQLQANPIYKEFSAKFPFRPFDWEESFIYGDIYGQVFIYDFPESASSEHSEDISNRHADLSQDDEAIVNAKREGGGYDCMIISLVYTRAWVI